MRTERLGVSVRMTVEDGHADLLPTLAGRLRSLDRGTWAFARVDGMTLKTVVGGSLGAPRGEPGGGGVAGDPRGAVIWIPTCPYG